MMRPIKFRAWDKSAKRMWEVTGINWRSTEQGGEIFYIRGNTEYNGHKNAPIGGHKDFCERFDDIILLEYTGLHDKNGKEIYEGDIVHYTYLPGKTFWNYEGDAIIEWNSTGYWMKPLPGKGGVNAALVSIPGAYEPTCREVVEVIGNIWENPDLLEEK